MSYQSSLCMLNSEQKPTYRYERHIHVHHTAAQMYHVRHEGGHRVRRRRTIRAEAIRLRLVTRVQRARDRSGRPREIGPVSSPLRVKTQNKNDRSG